jgi:hypothetical protein
MVPEMRRHAPPVKHKGRATGPRRVNGELLIDIRAASQLLGMSEKAIRSDRAGTAAAPALGTSRAWSHHAEKSW